jgi:hypothetical protein
MNHQQTQSPTNAIEMTSLAKSLTLFRQHLEAEAAEPIANLEVNAALLLSDLCQFLGLGAPQQSQVLGKHGTRYLATTLATQIDQASYQQCLCTHED